MIEINLLPEGMRIKKQSSNKPSQMNNLIYLLPLIIFIVIVIHIYLGIVFFTRSRILAGLEKDWKKLEPQRAEVLGLKNEINAESSDAQIVQACLAKRVLVAPKLNKLSLDLQPGIWFNSISFGRKVLVVRASVVSLKMDEMDVINTFMDSLKADNDFNRDLINIEIGAVQRKTVGSYDIVDFVVTAAIASKG